VDRAFSIPGSVFMKLTMRAAAKKVTLITTAFVLAVSTLTAAVPFVVAQKAAALSAVTVTPSNANGWVGVDDNGNGGSLGYVQGPATAPLGSGSAELSVTASNQGYLLAKAGYAGLKLSDITSLSYATYVQQGNNTIAPSLQFNIVANADTDTSWQGRLVYEPYQNGTVTDGVWQSHDALAGKWWFSKPNLFGDNCGQGSPCTFAQITALYPNAGVSQSQPMIAFKAGSSWTTFKGNVDNLNVNGTVYNFEPEPYVPTTPPTRPSLSGNVIFDSIPGVLPSNTPSLGYAATSTSAFGDKISFAGTDRHLSQVAVNLSSWACESNSWNGTGANACVTTPGATFSQPVTLNIYNVKSDGTVGTLVGTRTQTFNIPYRPTADPTCATPTSWRDTNGNCFNGLNHVVVFDASGITVPDTIIYSVAYNTQNYGVAPTGINGPYNSLNFAITPGVATVGTNVNTDEVFWDTTYPGYTAGLKADSGWATDGNPGVAFTATTPDTTKPQVSLTSPTVSTFDSTNTDLVVTATDYVALNKVVANIYKDGVLYKSTQSSASGAASYAHTIDLANVAGVGLLPVGSYSLRYNATDLAGNVSTTKTFNFTVVDKVKPVATLVTPTATVTGSNSVNIKVDATDDRGLNRIVANIYKDGALYKSTQSAIGGTTSGTHTATVTLPEGTYTIRYNASDVSGNVASTGQFTFTVDNSAPAAPEILTPTASAYINGQSTSNSWTTPDDIAGIAQYEVKYEFDGIPTAYHTLTANSRTQTFSGNYQGPITISVRAQDGVGNWSDWSAPVTYYYGIAAPATDNGGTQGGSSNPGAAPTTDDNSTPQDTTQQPQTQSVVLPPANGVNGLAAILGTNTTNPGDDTTQGTEGVEGTSTEKNLAAAVDTDSSDATVLGMAWYWWLLILAALATLIWWIIAALRNRSAEQN